MSRSRMTRRRLALASIAVLTVLCVVGVSILAVAAGGSSLAYEVNGHRVSQHDFDQQLDDVANSDIKDPNLSHSDGSITSQVSARLLTNTILRDLLRDAADRKGVEVTNADRAVGKQTAKSQLGANANRVPQSYRDVIVDTYAYANALGLTSNEALSAFVTREVKHADVYVNPRYGVWNPRFGVCPPTGCSATG